MCRYETVYLYDFFLPQSKHAVGNQLRRGMTFAYCSRERDVSLRRSIAKKVETYVGI